MKEKLFTISCTVGNSKWSDDHTEEEIMEFVRYASNDQDALHNLRLALKQYKKRIGFWELIKLMLNK